MIRRCYRKNSSILLILLLTGFSLLLPQANYSQTGRSAGGAISRMGHNKIGSKPRVRPPAKPKPPKTEKLKVQIVASPGNARIGPAYTFVARATGGAGSYRYQWSGQNLRTGNAKTSRLLNRNSMTASFANRGTSVIKVHVVDANNNIAEAHVAVQVR